ncbi:hypothetical protein P0E20_005054 [Vibrio harveyi]|nr:hypothetical protein [Vibrio harveyi]
MSTNPFMPRPIPVQYPNQYKGMEVELLKQRLAIHAGHWYAVDTDMNLHPIRPDLAVCEIDSSTVSDLPDGKLGKYIDAAGDTINQIRKAKVPVPFIHRGYEYLDIDFDSEKLHKVFQRREKYGACSFHDWAIKKIASNPTMETFGHSLEALGSAKRAFAHWIEAGKKEECRKFAEEARVPFNWEGVAHI